MNLRQFFPLLSCQNITSIHVLHKLESQEFDHMTTYYFGTPNWQYHHCLQSIKGVFFMWMSSAFIVLNIFLIYYKKYSEYCCFSYGFVIWDSLSFFYPGRTIFICRIRNARYFFAVTSLFYHFYIYSGFCLCALVGVLL